MNVYLVKTGSILPLGKQGENLARKIQFDISRWISSFGPGTVQLLHQRSGDEAPYPVAVEQDGNLAVWTVTSADTAAAGTGRAELQYYVGDALAKSETWMTKVFPALGDASETPPEAQQGWVDQVLAQVAKITGMTAQAVELPAGSAPTADYADGVLTIGIPLGGDVSEAQIAQAVEEYLSKNPITETDPTVPDWAKQPEKPSYTADEVGALSSETLPEAINTALAQANESGEFDGASGQDGAPGQDGITPTIGDNGNWYLGDTDTGKPSRGETGQAGADGRDGADGQPGADGKSAYQYAVEGGYTGTEEAFAAKMAAEIPAVDDTLTQIGQAADAAAVGGRFSQLSSGIRTETIVDAINFPQSMKVKKGTVVIDDRFVVREGGYGVVYADHALKLKCYCSKSGSYTTSLTVNGVKQNATLEYLDYDRFNLVFSDGDGSRKIIFADGDASIGASSGLSDGDIIEVKVSYASECIGTSTLTSDNLKDYKGILSVTNDRENIFSIEEQRLYVNDICSTIGTINRITATSLGLTSDKKGFIIYPTKTSLCATSDDTTAPHHKIYELGTLPNGLRLVYQACENSTTPFTDVNDIIVFTWAETPGTFKIESGRGYLSKAHTLVKNFDSFKANTTYVIWVRSSVVFAFEAQTGDLTIN